jgi:hypothetical protein
MSFGYASNLCLPIKARNGKVTVICLWLLCSVATIAWVLVPLFFDIYQRSIKPKINAVKETQEPVCNALFYTGYNETSNYIRPTDIFIIRLIWLISIILEKHSR